MDFCFFTFSHFHIFWIKSYTIELAFKDIEIPELAINGGRVMGVGLGGGGAGGVGGGGLVAPLPVNNLKLYPNGIFFEKMLP
jgi:hypothetical protein